MSAKTDHKINQGTAKRAAIRKKPTPPKGPIKLKTWEEVAKFKAKYLTPTGYGPKGQPIYSYQDMAKFDVIYPDEDE